MENLNSVVSSLQSNQDSSFSNITTFAAKIGDNVTDIVVINFSNQDLLLITQYMKVANLYKVEIDNPDTQLNISDTVYSVSHVSGSESYEALAAIRFLAEKLNLQKTTYVFLDLKTYERSVVTEIIETISEKVKGNDGISKKN
ncbi:hypothetical protein WA026_015093 [Henosepilachna vigintioctopunctata]|uniref:Proteasome assembly chaperone 3 n=1 Tax=Henosepilachna vigintioctopunctata TaxID=420089 RepID=A0AAW1UA12_9CUCU